jgi:DNA-binding XRE family transcriptional regulator
MRAARALRGTIQEIAPQIGVSPTTLNAMEKGDAVRPATEATILAGLARLNVDVRDNDGTGARLRFDG